MARVFLRLGCCQARLIFCPVGWDNQAMKENQVEFAPAESEVCVNALFDLGNKFSEGVSSLVSIRLRAQMPESKKIFDHIEEIKTTFANGKAHQDPRVSVPEDHVPLIKAALLAGRKREASEVEILSLRTNNPSAKTEIRKNLTNLETLLSDRRFKDVESLRIPRLTDFLTIQEAEEALSGRGQIDLGERLFDEKFNILLSPSLVADDMKKIRLRCSLRDVPMSVAFVDIDDFKHFNVEYTEPVVDEIVLPSFMSALEAHVFGRGYAYRQGGDEYLVICPNLTAGQTGLLFSEFQEKLQELELPGVSEKISVSVGVCTALPECELTDRELVRFASKAKQVAKERGKHRVVGYTGPTYDQEPVDLSVP